MLRFHKPLISVIILLAASSAYASDYRLNYKIGVWPYRGFVEGKESLQGPFPSISQKLELSYLFGGTEGLLAGVGYGLHHAEYEQAETATKTYGEFESSNSSLFVKLGYWRALNYGILVEAYASFGRGTFRFGNVSKTTRMQTVVNRWDVGSMLSYPLEPISSKNGIRVDLMGGAELFQMLVPSFAYDSIDYSSDKISTPGIYFYVGIGIRY